jgi:hypothetical protein
VSGLRQIASHLASADSMAWSFEARRKRIVVPGCTGHINCANCLIWALQWRARVLASPDREPPVHQAGLFDGLEPVA